MPDLLLECVGGPLDGDELPVQGCDRHFVTRFPHTPMPATKPIEDLPICAPQVIQGYYELARLRISTSLGHYEFHKVWWWMGET